MEKVSVDDVDARQYDPADLRTGGRFCTPGHRSLLRQDPRQYCRSGKPTATDGRDFSAAARLAGVESFIAGHPLGYDMPIAEGGRSLSGGQKQAIGLARALIRRPKVLFLDEPTAHFDVRKAKRNSSSVWKALGEEGLTIMISTHRLSLLSFVDRIPSCLNAAKLVADGPRGYKVIAMLRERANQSGRADRCRKKGVKTVA